VQKLRKGKGSEKAEREGEKDEEGENGKEVRGERLMPVLQLR